MSDFNLDEIIIEDELEEDNNTKENEEQIVEENTSAPINNDMLDDFMLESPSMDFFNGEEFDLHGLNNEGTENSLDNNIETENNEDSIDSLFEEASKSNNNQNPPKQDNQNSSVSDMKFEDPSFDNDMDLHINDDGEMTNPQEVRPVIREEATIENKPIEPEPKVAPTPEPTSAPVQNEKAPTPEAAKPQSSDDGHYMMFDNTSVDDFGMETMHDSNNNTIQDTSHFNPNFDEDAVEEEPFMSEFYSNSAYDELEALEQEIKNKTIDKPDVVENPIETTPEPKVAPKPILDENDENFESPSFEEQDLNNITGIPMEFEAPTYQEPVKEVKPAFEAPRFETPVFEAPVFETPVFENNTYRIKTKKEIKEETRRLQKGSKDEKRRREMEERKYNMRKGKKSHPVRKFFIILFIVLLILAVLIVLLGILGVTGKLQGIQFLQDLYMNIKDFIKDIFKKYLSDYFDIEDVYKSIKGFF